MKLTIRAAVILLLILGLFSGTLSALGSNYTENVFLSVNGLPYENLVSQASTVQEFLTEQGVGLTEGDTITPPLDTRITAYIMVKVSRALTINLRSDSANITVKYPGGGTLAQFISWMSECTGKYYFYDYDDNALETALTDGADVALSTSGLRLEVAVEDIPFETELVTSASVSHEMVISDGVPGQRVIKTQAVYILGKKTEQSVIYDQVDRDPQKRVVMIPADRAVSSSGNQVMEYGQHYTMSATAYTCDPRVYGADNGSKYYGLTASGMKARVGVVAVDPTVIPLGTELYISGYGYAIAGDTGGAIKGLKIDLFYNTLEECTYWGRRNVEVYVIKG